MYVERRERDGQIRDPRYRWFFFFIIIVVVVGYYSGVV